MAIAMIWNKSSTNYGQNEFVRNNGTGQIKINNEAEVTELIFRAINNPDVQRVDLLFDFGKMVWTRKNESSMDFCECGGCSECLNDLEEFKQDIEDDTDFDWGDTVL